MRIASAVKRSMLEGLICLLITGIWISPVIAASGNMRKKQPVAKNEQAALPAAPAQEPAKITGLSIEKGSRHGNAVVATMSGEGQFSFKKTAPSEYVLTIKDAPIDPALASTVVAPQGSGAIRSVRPVMEGKNTLLRIFAQPEATLEVKADDDKIQVAEAGNFEEEAPDMRAQLAPEKVMNPSEPPHVTAATGTNAGQADSSTAASKPAPAGDEPAKAEVKNSDNTGKDGAITNADLSSLLGDSSRYTGRLISLDLQDTDIDNALRIIAEVSNLNIIASDDVTGKVTLRLIDVPWDQALDVILKTNGLDSVQEGNVIRIAPVEKLRQEREALKHAKQAEEELEPLQVKYIRVSYAKAGAIKPILDTVISERGSVTFDERTNQVIVKDIARGVRNVSELIAKLDLRTPQVLLETQIVEANRTLLRDLGSELGFSYIQSPATGNATGRNFPNAINIGGSRTSDSNIASSFPAAFQEGGPGAAVSMLFDSADGSKGLDLRITALEQEGRIRIISRPAVATTNNTQAFIESTETIRVKKPSGGLSVATGQGAYAEGNSSDATEKITAGIKLTVTPQASPDYYVLLDIAAESSSFNFARQVDGIPSAIVRHATSVVLVSSGQTFAMGGIYKIRDDDQVSGVPFFKDVPVIGHLFRDMKTDNSDEELLFFITPRIVEGSFDDAAMKLSS